jgi:hypothetical protein
MKTTTQLTVNNIFLSVFYLIFVCKLFSPGQLQWLLPPMEVSKLQHTLFDALDEREIAR